MRKTENSLNVEGKIYQFNLDEKVTGENSKAPGTHYISGTIDVAIDSTLENIVQVHYTYVAPTYSSGKTNMNYTILKQIIDSGKTVITDGYAAATVVKLNPSYAVNDFYPQGQDTVVTQPRNEGGFVAIVPENTLHPEGDVGRHKFTVDMVISNVAEVVPDEGDSYVTIKGIAFNYNNTAALPITVTARNKAAGDYFLGLGASNDHPVFTRLWGRIVNTITKIEKTTESAFGEATVDIVTKRNKEYVVTGANPVPYEFGSEESITAAELQKILQDREIYLANEKKRTEEYRASQSGNANGVATSAQAAVPQGAFKF